MKVLVADDHRLMVEGIRRALESAEDIEVVGEASTGSQVLPLVRRLHPDVVLLDMRMPQMDGLTCLDQLQKNCPDVKVIVLSVFSDPERIQAAFKHGASGYIVKSVNPIDLPSAIRQAVEGTVFHAVGLPEVDEQSLGKAAGLTERELSILKAVARAFQRCDRQRALGHRADGEIPPDEHLPQAQSREQDRGRSLRVSARPGRESSRRDRLRRRGAARTRRRTCMLSPVR